MIYSNLDFKRVFSYFVNNAVKAFTGDHLQHDQVVVFHAESQSLKLDQRLHAEGRHRPHHGVRRGPFPIFEGVREQRLHRNSCVYRSDIWVKLGFVGLEQSHLKGYYCINSSLGR